MKSSLLRLFLVPGICAFSICSGVCFTQTDPKNVPQPPTAELKKFDPFPGAISGVWGFREIAMDWHT